MTYIDSFNHCRLHGEIADDNGYTTPAEAEAAYYRQTTRAIEAATQWPSAVTRPEEARFTNGGRATGLPSRSSNSRGQLRQS